MVNLIIIILLAILVFIIGITIYLYVAGDKDLAIFTTMCAFIYVQGITFLIAGNSG